MPKKVEWDEATIELLKTLWEKGLSATEIMPEIPYSTRSGIMGKVHRLGLTRGGQPPKPTTAPTTPKLVPDQRPLKLRQPTKVKKMSAEVKPLFTAPIVEIGGPVDYLELREFHCRAPLEDRGEWGLRKCCGKPRLKRHGSYVSSYCADCDKIFRPGKYLRERTG